MKKNEFVSLVAERTDMSKKDTDKVMRAARSGRNPRTGEVIEIEQATLPVFKAGRTLKDKVNAK